MTQTLGEFVTDSRVHMGLAVQDLQQSVAFYQTLFGQEPSKTRAGYAKYEVAEPPLNLSLNQVGGQTGPNNPVTHFGIQVKTSAAVSAVARRLAEAGVATKVEENVTCCYARQHKVWVTDPDGNNWEVYVVLDENGAHHHSSASECCQQNPAMMQADTAAQDACLQECDTSDCSCSR